MCVLMYREDSVNWNSEKPLGRAVMVAVLVPNTIVVASEDMVMVNVSVVNGTYMG